MNITPDRYRHYEGNDYEVIGGSRHSETLELLVPYRGLYDSPEFGSQPLWTRPLTDFTANITINGTAMPRFTRL